ncbi:crossover junction endodeoxyribonuclease RuvC [Aquiluna borgnonia]|uniref:Crossover junction endodeoxyribonuclease RuvC n=1 Tax=Aquiluna borgnonia TaxID=2499157 RepID=A0A7D4TJ02_9MICO|nr:crossover junction endodeoxyribonuclease RuvC [Aquiluna borgnonia]QKJ25251.1 crossover junction endodeoxyribonuclease RuvC [Aquiluna borgnonia]
MALILGVDPGLTRCGFGLVDSEKNSAIRYGMFQSTPDQDPSERVGRISQQLAALLDEHRPELIGLERVFAQANLRSVMGVAQISGALMALAFERNIPLQFFTPSEVKAAVTGNGRATKDQVGMMVTRILQLDSQPKPADVADALAVAICASKRGFNVGTSAQQAWVAAAKKASRRLG